METIFQKVPIYPLARYLPPAEQGGLLSPKVPHVFEYDGATVSVDEVLGCERTVSRRVGGRGFRFTCRVSWTPSGGLRSKQSAVWYDDFYDSWFLEVPESRMPKTTAGGLLPGVALPAQSAGQVAFLHDGRKARVPIFPLVRYLRPAEKNGIPSGKVPYAFALADATIVVERMLVCEETMARKEGDLNQGFRFVCNLSRQQPGAQHMRECVLWFDEVRDAWYYEVPESWARQGWANDPWAG